MGVLFDSSFLFPPNNDLCGALTLADTACRSRAREPCFLGLPVSALLPLVVWTSLFAGCAAAAPLSSDHPHSHFLSARGPVPEGSLVGPVLGIPRTQSAPDGSVRVFLPRESSLQLLSDILIFPNFP